MLGIIAAIISITVSIIKIVCIIIEKNKKNNILYIHHKGKKKHRDNGAFP